MFRAMIYFAGFATLSASAAFALVVAHDTLNPEHQAVAPVVTARAAPIETTPLEPTRLVPAPQMTATAPLQPGSVIKHDMTATLTSLRPQLRAKDRVVSRVPVKTASIDPFQSIERLNPSDLRADVPVMSFQNDTTDGQGQTANANPNGGVSPDRSAPVATYKSLAVSNPYVARSAPATTGQRLANNWNVGVYR